MFHICSVLEFKVATAPLSLASAEGLLNNIIILCVHLGVCVCACVSVCVHVCVCWGEERERRDRHHSHPHKSKIYGTRIPEIFKQNYSSFFNPSGAHILLPKIWIF